MSKQQVLYAKVLKKHSLGVTRSIEITGEYFNKKDATASTEAGVIYPIDEAKSMVEAFNAKKQSVTE